MYSEKHAFRIMVNLCKNESLNCIGTKLQGKLNFQILLFLYKVIINATVISDPLTKTEIMVRENCNYHVRKGKFIYFKLFSIHFSMVSQTLYAHEIKGDNTQDLHTTVHFNPDCDYNQELFLAFICSLVLFRSISIYIIRCNTLWHSQYFLSFYA